MENKVDYAQMFWSFIQNYRRLNYGEYPAILFIHPELKYEAVRSMGVEEFYSVFGNIVNGTEKIFGICLVDNTRCVKDRLMTLDEFIAL